jgi:hypothetical protein
MKWKTHAAITKAVCHALELDEDYERIMLAGVVEPDRNPEQIRSRSDGKRRKVRHHSSPDRIIMMFVWKARLAFLEGNYEEGSRNLGRALHYVQDRAVPMGRFSFRHDRMEKEIARRNVPQDAIHQGIQFSLPSPVFIYECIHMMRPRRDSTSALFHATVASAAIASSVVSYTEPSDSLRYKHEKTLRRHEMVMWPLCIIMGLSVAISGITFGHWEIIALSPLVSTLILCSDRDYYRFKKLARWYGIE